MQPSGATSSRSEASRAGRRRSGVTGSTGVPATATPTGRVPSRASPRRGTARGSRSARPRLAQPAVPRPRVRPWRTLPPPSSAARDRPVRWTRTLAPSRSGSGKRERHRLLPARARHETGVAHHLLCDALPRDVRHLLRVRVVVLLDLAEQLEQGIGRHALGIAPEAEPDAAARTAHSHGLGQCALTATPDASEARDDVERRVGPGQVEHVAGADVAIGSPRQCDVDQPG